MLEGQATDARTTLRPASRVVVVVAVVTRRLTVEGVTGMRSAVNQGRRLGVETPPLPFFYGRSVFVLFESRSLGSTTGPAVGF